VHDKLLCYQGGIAPFHLSMATQQQPPANLAPQDGAAIQTRACPRTTAPDPSTEAAAYLDATRHDGIPSLAFWRDAWHRWRASAYHVVPPSEVRADLIRWLTPRCRPLTSHFTNNVLDCLQALAMLPGWVEQPTWRDNDGPAAAPWPADEMLATPQALIHLPSFSAQHDSPLAARITDVRRHEPNALPPPLAGEIDTPPAEPPAAADARPALPPDILALSRRSDLERECHEVMLAPRPVGGEAVLAWPDYVGRADGGNVAYVRRAQKKSSPACYAQPATPRFFNATALEFDFDENAPPPVEWLRFLASMWHDDLLSIELLQDWFGYLLTPDTSHQKILLAVGPQRSGKGTIARVARALVGSANVAAPTLTSLGSRFALGPLIGKSLAIIPDARLSHRVDIALVTERLLSTSGEDLQTVERKNQDPVTLRLPTRLMVLSNELPQLSDSSGALASRILLLRTERTFLEQEIRALAAKLLVELPGILCWAIVGWQRLRTRGYFVQPEEGLDLLEELSDLNSPIGAFIKERCQVGYAEWRTSASDLFAAWRAWCRANGRRDCGSVQTFGRDLKAALPALRTAYPRGSGYRRIVYDGIRLSSVG